MKSRTVLILALVFLALGAWVYFYEIKGGEKRKETKEEADRVFSFKKEEITELLLRPARIHLKKEGESWVLTEPVQAGVEKWTVEGLLASIEGVRRERLVEERPQDYAPYGLKPPKFEVEIFHGSKRDTLYLGDKNATETYVFAKKGSEPQVFLTSTSILWNVDKKPFDFRDKTVLAFERDQVRKFVLRADGKKFSLVKTEGKWKLEEPVQDEADQTKADQLISTIRDAKAREFVEENPADLKPYGLAKPRLIADLFVGQDQIRKTLLIGSTKGDKAYAKDEARNPVFLVDTTLVHGLRVNLFDLRDKKLTALETTQVASLEFSYPDHRIICQKDTAGTWTIVEPEKQPAKSWKVNSLLSIVSNLKAESFVDDSPKSLVPYGLDQPRVRIVAKSGSGKILGGVLLGKTKDSKLYAKGLDKKPVVLVKADDVKDLMVTLSDVAEEKVASTTAPKEKSPK